MSKHTPGPWTANELNWVDVPVGRDGAELVADCDVGPWVETEKAANARLIAAAPDLLEACDRALYALTPPRNDEEKEAVETLRAAIAKARGE